MGAGESAWIEILNGDWSGPLRLRVQGRSMWPSLRPGDQVTVEPVAVEALHAGDYVLVEQQGQLFLHRFLGFDRQGRLLTKGDGHRTFDPPWPQEALRGRAVTLSRDGKAMPISPSSLRGRVQTGIHRALATTWSLLRRIVPLILLLGLFPAAVLAAVVLVEGSFQAIPVEPGMRIVWQTASETVMKGFYVHRAPYQALSPGAECKDISGLEPLPGFVWAQGDFGGASYAYTDTQNLVVGQVYYYCLEAEEQGDSSQFHGPITGIIPLPATPTPTPRSPLLPPATSTSTPTPTSTPTITSTVTSTVTPGVNTPSATPSLTPATVSSTPSPTPSPSPSTEATSSVASDTPMPTSTLSTSTPSIGAEATEAPTEPAASAATSTPALDQTPSTTVVAASTATQASAAASPVQTPDGTAASAAQATTSLSSPPVPSPARRPETDDKPQVAWGIVLLALIAGGGGLILLGAWGIWWARRKT